MAADVQRRLEPVAAGARFEGKLTDLLGPDGRLDHAALDTLTAAIVVRRRNALEVLVDAARRADSLYAIGGNLIRDPRVVDVLTGTALERRDAVRGDGLDALLASVPAPLLHERGEALLENLRLFPDETALTVIAKTKPEKGADVAEGIARSPAFAGTESGLVARAALGNRDVEQRLIEEFLLEKDPLEKERRARVLGMIGTPAAQRALALELRSPLVFEIPHVLRRSVRLAVLEALRQSFPEEPSLIETQIEDDAGYERAEKFLEKALGIAYPNPRPSYLKIEGFPTA
ncbi:MAG: hypothetical protein ABR567_11760 [Myxococcales bacterium]